MDDSKESESDDENTKVTQSQQEQKVVESHDRAPPKGHRPQEYHYNN